MQLIHQKEFCIDPTKPSPNLKPGTQSGDPFQLAAQLQVAKMYFDGIDPVNYKGHTYKNKFISVLKQALKYDHAHRTPFDELVALIMALLPMFGSMADPEEESKKEEKPKSIWPRYAVRMTG